MFHFYKWSHGPYTYNWFSGAQLVIHMNFMNHQPALVKGADRQQGTSLDYCIMVKLGHVTTQLTELSSDRARLFDLCSDTVLCYGNELTEIPFLITKQLNGVNCVCQLNFRLMDNCSFGLLVWNPRIPF